MELRTLVTAVSLILLGVTAGCSDDNKVNTNNSQDSNTASSDVIEVDNTIIDGVINEFIATNRVVGLSVATVKQTADETLIWSSQYGFKNREEQAPVDGETSFWMGSVSKAVMGTVLMVANEKGFVQLDEDIHGILTSQGSFTLDNPNQQPVTIAQLASHTSGIVDNDAYECAYFVPTGDGGHDKLINIIEPGSCPEGSSVSLPGFLGSYLDADGEFFSDTNFIQSMPGEEYEYSNIGAGLAGYMVELTTGQDLAVYAHQEIFSPLAMSNTSWNREDLQIENIAIPYFLFDEIDGPLDALPIYELATWPDGGLRSNATDLAELLGVVMNNGEHQATGLQLLSEASIERLLPAAGSNVGFFWEIEEDLLVSIDGEDRLLPGHTGSDPGAFSVMVFDPISDTGVVIVGNADDETIDESAIVSLLEAMFVRAGQMQ